MKTLQQVWDIYQAKGGAMDGRGMGRSLATYYACRDWILADHYGINSDVRFSWFPFRLNSPLPSRLPK